MSGCRRCEDSQLATVAAALIDFGVEHKRCNLLARMGMGKTPAVLEIHDRLRLLGEVASTS